MQELINRPLLIGLLLGATLLQTVVPLARISTSYRAIEAEMSAAQIGQLSAAYALLPLLLATLIGRRNDKNGEGQIAILGAALIAIAVTGLEFVEPSFISLLIFTSILGIGQLMLLSSLQLVTTLCSAPQHHDQILGHFLVASSLGHVLGPLILSLVTPAGSSYPSPTLAWLLLGTACALCLCAFQMSIRLPVRVGQPSVGNVPIRAILRTPGLSAVIMAGSLCQATNDLVLVFFPVLAAARGMDATTVGILLGLRAAASMLSRALFAKAGRWMGKLRLMGVSLILTGLTTGSMMFKMPLWVTSLVLSGSGFLIGLAIASSLSLALALAPQGARATAMSVRLSAARLMQFLVPLGAGAVAAALGPGSAFALMGAGLLFSGVALAGRRASP